MRSLPFLAGAVLTIVGCGDGGNDDPFQTGGLTGDSNGSAGTTTLTTSAGTDAGSDSASGTSGDTDGDSASSSDSDSTSDSTSDSGGPKFDVMESDIGPTGCNNPDGECGCNAVDIVFVIDNSGSMASAQAAIGQAFPQFADAMVEILPPATSLHVGVTSTEMGYVSGGSTTNCTASSNGQPASDFYITPDQNDSGVNGAQGRLYVANGMPYYEVSTDDATGIDGLKNWFSAAAAIGTGGSNIEMSTAGAGWVGDPVNDATNAGFIRDAGAVLVVFFLQDEPDQTPNNLGMEMLNKLAARKQQCGGADCIIGGGMINEGCVPETAMGDFLAGLGAPAVTANFPFIGDPTPDDFVAILKDTLAGVIAQKCDEIPPVG